MAVYSTTLTRSVRNKTILGYDEDVFYGGVRVLGVSVTLTVRTPDGIKAWDFTVVANDRSDTRLNQQVDILYGGVVVGRLSVVVVPDATLPNGHGVEALDTSWSQPVPAEIVTQILA